MEGCAGDGALHLALDLLQQFGQFALVCWFRRPADAQSFLLIRLRNQMEMHMIDLLVRYAAIVLQDVVVVDVLSQCDPLGD